MVDKVTLIKDIAPSFTLVHWLNKGNFLMAAWDYIMTHGRHWLSTGEIVHTFYCTTHDDYPEDEKIVRQTYLNGAWILKPTSETSTKITKITECDVSMK